MYDLPKKEIEKANRELIDIHKKTIKGYLVGKDMKLGKRRKFFIIYDFYINVDNIRNYFFTPVDIFIKCLITDNLELIMNYFNKNKSKRKSKKNAKNNNFSE